MLEQHIQEDVLRQKITLLFEYRLFPALISKGNESKQQSDIFLQKLIDLQTAIYHLDAHLEVNWETNPKLIKWHWDNIKKYLSVFDIDRDSSDTYLNHIKKYEKHEQELRVGKVPLRLDMEYFYFYKSCDVKLLRRLIYEHYRLSPECGKLADWRYYDLVTEVNDDVEDLFEDLDFINGNRFLISLLYYGKKVTEKVFIDFLDLVSEKAKFKFETGTGSFRKEMYDQTMTRVIETKKLVQTQLDKLESSTLQTSKLVQFLDVKALII